MYTARERCNRFLMGYMFIFNLCEFFMVDVFGIWSTSPMEHDFCTYVLSSTLFLFSFSIDCY